MSGRVPPPGDQPTVWSVPHARVGFGVTRMRYTERRVTVIGAVPFEPSMVRVRTEDGHVHRAMREHLR